MVYRALIIDSLETQTDDVKDKITKAFDRGDPRLTGLRIVPVPPTIDTDIAMIALAASNHNGIMINTTHHTFRGFKTLDLKITNKAGTEQTLREFFANFLVPVRDIRIQLIQRTERATENIIYLIHLKEHSPMIKNLIKNLDANLLKNFTEEAFQTSRGDIVESNRVLNQRSTSATRKNAALLKSLFGDPTQHQNTQPAPRSNQRKHIQAQYPHEYPKLPTGKLNAWDNR